VSKVGATIYEIRGIDMHGILRIKPVEKQPSALYMECDAKIYSGISGHKLPRTRPLCRRFFAVYQAEHCGTKKYKGKM